MVEHTPANISSSSSNNTVLASMPERPLPAGLAVAVAAEAGGMSAPTTPPLSPRPNAPCDPFAIAVLWTAESQRLGGYYLHTFKSRLTDPYIGDKVEVAWRGKFRLEASEVYQGLAWWVAEVVDKHAAQGKYKIRYPGWESRWDEWVPRSRLRWAVERNNLAKIKPDAVVELWCCGANVPGAWLETRVKRVRNGRYCVGRVLSTGSLWVDGDRLRLVKQGTRMG